MSQIIDYKCPCCGGKIEFDSSLQQMKCPYCETTFDVAAMLDHDAALSQQPQQDMHWQQGSDNQWQDGEADGMAVYVCNSCGGEIIADQNTAATHCPYCGNPVVFASKLSGDLRPDYIIPFKLDKEAAKAAFRRHLSDKKLLPKLFRSENHLDEIKGVYVPFWLFDADADADIRYNGTKMRVWQDLHYTYTETQFYSIVRGGTLNFSRIPVDGSSKIDNDLMESIEPFDLKDLVDFQTAYLSGYLADRYDVAADDSMERVNERVRQTTEETFSQTVQGYVTVTPAKSDIRLINGTAKYALYPVWFMTTSWNGGQYLFAMNGQTGKFVGDLPMDKGTYWKYRLLYWAIFAAVIFGLSWLFSSVF